MYYSVPIFTSLKSYYVFPWVLRTNDQESELSNFLPKFRIIIQSLQLIGKKKEYPFTNHASMELSADWLIFFYFQMIFQHIIKITSLTRNFNFWTSVSILQSNENVAENATRIQKSNLTRCPLCHYIVQCLPVYLKNKLFT